MGIYLHLIDERAPGGFEIILDGVPRAYRKLRVTAGEAMTAVVERICHEFRRWSLDVIRICSHGNASAPDIGFGERLNCTNASAFRLVRPLWRVLYAPDDHGMSYRVVVPRIEIHSCGAANGAQAMCGALASAAGAPVFASLDDQEAGSSWLMEGRLRRFNPW